MKDHLKKTISILPKSPGVYKYFDQTGKIIYVGKATSLKDRVGSYFTGAHDTKTEKLVSEIKKIKFQKTETVLEALILESELIKKNQPKYNIKDKDDKSFSYFSITKNEKFPRILIVRKTDLGKIESKKIYGPYTSKRQAEIVLKLLRKIFPFHSRKESSEKGCLDFEIGRCPGPYAGAISKKDYLKNIRGIEAVLSGKKKILIKKLEQEMKNFSKEQKFEKAAEIRNTLFALKHIQDVALILGDEANETFTQSTKKIRIEGYDISNISGDFAVGSMVVFKNSKPQKSEYRKFKIKNISKINDIGMMKEIIERRFENDWKKPDLILLDGGKGHLNMATKVLLERNLNIPIIAVAKGPTRKKLDLFHSKNISSFANIVSDLKLIEQIRNEAHRFAIKYHREVRGREWRK